MKKVVKFGGSSLASAAQFEKVGAITRKDKSKRKEGLPRLESVFLKTQR